MSATLLRSAIRRVIREGLLTEAACPECGDPGAYVGFTAVECPNPRCSHYVAPPPGSSTDFFTKGNEAATWALAQLGRSTVDSVERDQIDLQGLSLELHPWIENDLTLDDLKAVMDDWEQDEALRLKVVEKARQLITDYEQYT